MKPAPPVIIIFLTSGRGSYLVLPVKTGASFHTPKSSKNLLLPSSVANELMVIEGYKWWGGWHLLWAPLVPFVVIIAVKESIL